MSKKLSHEDEDADPNHDGHGERKPIGSLLKLASPLTNDIAPIFVNKFVPAVPGPKARSGLTGVLQDPVIDHTE